MREIHLAGSFRRGELPLWDPFQYCGMPFYADLTAQLFYPPTLATIALSNLLGGTHLRYLLDGLGYRSPSAAYAKQVKLSGA